MNRKIFGFSLEWQTKENKCLRLKYMAEKKSYFKLTNSNEKCN